MINETYHGIVIGIAAFVIIALGRYLCIVGEYYFTKRFWIAFLAIGMASLAGSLMVDDNLLSAILGINGFTFLWGIHEIIEQEERVKKGWFPKNPKKKS